MRTLASRAPVLRSVARAESAALRRPAAPPPPRAARSDAAAAASGTSPPPPPPRSGHLERQAAHFDAAEAATLAASITPAVDARLATVAAAAPGLGPASRVLDVGAGTGALIPHLQRLGVADVLAVDAAPAMVAALAARFGPGELLGNAPCVRPWLGDALDVPAYQGPFDAAFFVAVLGNFADPRAALLHAALLLRPGGRLVVAHPLGRGWHDKYRAAHPALVPHALPARAELEAAIFDLPLELESFVDEEDMYLAVLRVPEGYARAGLPLRLAGAVVPGFGRGSAALGVPTANLDPAPLAAALAPLPAGVYFGFARLADAPAGSPDAGVFKMAMNVGRRPTFEDGGAPALSVELHLMHEFGADFYGRPLRAVALGFLRPEVKFSGLPALLDRIHADLGAARAQLDTERWAAFEADPFLFGE
jgi:riboflavin kinase